MSSFFRFPHTPHLEWLGEGSPRDDKVLSPAEAKDLLAGEVVVEEKLDGANVGFSIGSDGGVRVQNRGQYLEEPFHGQFSRLTPWLAQHRETLEALLTLGLILFGEWCAAKHSVAYRSLPDWFLGFDVYDRAEGRFWSTRRRNDLLGSLGFAAVPCRFRGHADLPLLTELLRTEASQYDSGPMEGVVIRSEDSSWLLRRAKLVRADFTQSIAEHWSRRSIEWNRVSPEINAPLLHEN
jgi:ATP-dependent RNA circularization protein (DNA/RNA ligase family)